MRRPASAAVAALGLAGVLLYLPAVQFGFVRADDTRLIVENAPFLADLSNLPEVLRRSYFEVAGEVTGERTYYRPVVVTSFMLDAQVDGPTPWPYHVTNIGIHILAVWLLFALLRRLGIGPEAAFGAALIFAVHPMNVQAVAWIPGRNDPLMTVFALGSFLALIAWVGRGPGQTGAALLVAHVLGFALALLSKETALVFIPLFLLYGLLWRRRPLPRRDVTVLGLSYGLVVAVWLVLRRAALEGSAPALSPGQYATIAAANLPDLLLYAAKAVLPVNLTTMPGLTPWLAVQGGVAAVALLLMLVSLPDGRRALFAGAWFVAPLLPGLLVVGLPAYEHRAYVPLIGLAIAAAIGYPRLAARAPWRARVAAGLICAAFVVLSARHLGTFRDPFTYWSNGAEGTPHAPVAHINLGRLYEEREDLERAAVHYRRALELDPYTLMAHNNLGVILMRTDRPEEAGEHFRREVTLHPYNAQGHYNLGLYYSVTGRPADAVPHWQRVLELDPYHLDTYGKLIEYFEARGDQARAAAYREKVRALERAAR